MGAHVLEMPYKGDEVSMFVLLPPFAKENGKFCVYLKSVKNVKMVNNVMYQN